MHAGAAGPGYGVEFLPEHDVAAIAGPVNEGDIARKRGEHGPQRRDADPAGQQQYLAPRPGRGQRAVRAFGDDTSAWTQAAHGTTVVTVLLDRYPQDLRMRHGGQGVWVGRPPQATGQEPPAEELARLAPQPGAGRRCARTPRQALRGSGPPHGTGAGPHLAAGRRRDTTALRRRPTGRARTTRCGPAGQPRNPHQPRTDG